MITYSDGKTTYSDGDSLSGDLGEKVRRGDKDALQKLKEFAANKDPEQPHSQARALYELAKVHFNGFCDVKKSATEALKFLIQAVELNDDLASIRLGEFYRDGLCGFKQDGQKALELFLKAAESENKNGLRLAAEMFREGQGGFKADGYRAIEFYEKLDALDDKQAPMNIAEIYTEGCGKFKADGYKSIEIYDDIIRHGEYWIKIHHDFGIDSYRLKNYKEALNNAARIYLEGKGGVAPDGYKAIEYLSKNIEYDNDAREAIAEIYLEGKAGVEPDGNK
ncbi:MAG: sel1 repeat family protein, partial [Selenomonadaceae bacterium]|nr:sel1 repeat family protein [Selenomonadaceae bacterium]